MPRTLRVLRFRGLPLTVLWLAAASACAPSRPAPAPAPAASDEEPAAYFYTDRGIGTDLYAGPFDALFNKGYAVAQWEDRNRSIFRHDYGWEAVRASLFDPGPAIRRAGGWGEVLKVHALPFYQGGSRDPQWVTNWFGHVFEGGLVYRRLAEWNQAHGVPLPRTSAAVATWVSALVNEAYETPPAVPGTPEVGHAGIFMDLVVFDPLGILLFTSDRVASVAHGLNLSLWPSQGSLVVNTGQLQNNGQALIFKVPLPWTRHRFFLRTGVGVEAGFSWRRSDGLDVTAAAGMQSYDRSLDPETGLESARLAPSASLWLDRDGVLLASLTLDTRTDRRVGLNVYPGIWDPGGFRLGGWTLVDADGRVYLGLTGRALGLGLGWGF